MADNDSPEISGASLSEIYSRLKNAEKYHPGSASTYADWSMQAGDRITMAQGDKSYDVPVFASTMLWQGTPSTTIETTGQEKRESISAVAERKYNGGRGSGGYNNAAEYNTRITQTENDITLEAWNRENADNEMDARITITADKIANEVTTRRNGEIALYSKIEQTAAGIRQEIENTKLGLRSFVSDTAGQYYRLMEDRTNQLYSQIRITAREFDAKYTDMKNQVTSQFNVTAGQIQGVVRSLDGIQSSELILHKDEAWLLVNNTSVDENGNVRFKNGLSVTQNGTEMGIFTVKGKSRELTAGVAVEMLSDGKTKTKIKGDYIDFEGNVTAEYIAAKAANVNNFSVQQLTSTFGYTCGGTVSAGGFSYRSSSGGAPVNLLGAGGFVKRFGTATVENNIVSIPYYSFSGDEIGTLSFEKAATVTGDWSGGTYTVSGAVNELSTTLVGILINTAYDAAENKYTGNIAYEYGENHSSMSTGKEVVLYATEAFEAGKAAVGSTITGSWLNGTYSVMADGNVVDTTSLAPGLVNITVSSDCKTFSASPAYIDGNNYLSTGKTVTLNIATTYTQTGSTATINPYNAIKSVGWGEACAVIDPPDENTSTSSFSFVYPTSNGGTFTQNFSLSADDTPSSTGHAYVLKSDTVVARLDIGDWYKEGWKDAVAEVVLPEQIDPAEMKDSFTLKRPTTVGNNTTTTFVIEKSKTPAKSGYVTIKSGNTSVGRVDIGDWYSAGWKAAAAKVDLPRQIDPQDITDTFTLGRPTSVDNDTTTTFTINKSETPSATGYATVKSGNTTVGRIEIGDWYSAGWKAAVAKVDLPRQIDPQDITDTFTLGRPTSVDKDTTTTFTINKSETPGATGYVTVKGGSTTVGRIEIGDWYSAGWRAAVAKVALPRQIDPQDIADTFTLGRPTSVGNDTTTTFTINKSATPGATGYVTVKAGSTTVGRISIGDWYKEGWEAAVSKVVLPEQCADGEVTTFTLGRPTSVGNDTTTTFTLTQGTPGTSGYAAVRMGNNTVVGRIDISNWYRSGWDAAASKVVLPETIASGVEATSFTLGRPTSVGNDTTTTFTLSKGTPSADGGYVGVAMGQDTVGRIDISNWWSEGYAAGHSASAVTVSSLGYSNTAPTGKTRLWSANSNLRRGIVGYYTFSANGKQYYFTIDS